jgi:hypothetical protein
MTSRTLQVLEEILECEICLATDNDWVVKMRERLAAMFRSVYDLFKMLVFEWLDLMASLYRFSFGSTGVFFFDMVCCTLYVL